MIETNSHPGKIYKQMALVLSDVEAIKKTRRNTQGTGYMFRGVDDAYNMLHPIFAKHGVFTVPTVLDSLREERKSNSGGLLLYTILTVKYTFYADDGSSVDAIVKGEAFDSGDKSTNKAMSAAQKYLIFQTFLVPTEEDNDTENSSPIVAPRDETKKSVKSPVAPNTETKKADWKSQPASDAQRRLVWAKIKSELNYEDDIAKAFITTITGKGSSKDLTMADIDTLITSIDAYVKDINTHG